MIRIKKLFAGSFASALAVTALIAGTVVVAAPAQATPADCQRYLADRGYVLTDARINGCSYGRDTQWLCWGTLQNSGVARSHAVNACDLANN
ncbi:hypothetical protein ACH4U6_16355 [Streptomyces netropsis]|uniref:hypothetical protein n=1 Tax=Streptomyces netropsis TaxID=55404 RepID=UPI0037BD1935